MYESFFGLSREPFSVAPDPRFLYMSQQHREALEHLNYGLRRGGGFVLLTGEIGAGKTTVWRCFLEQLPSDFDVASVVNPKLGVAALLARVCEDLRVELPDVAPFAAPSARVGSTRPAEPDRVGERIVDPIDALHGHLLLAHARGRRTLIVVDEAQALSLEVLEQLRLLTNLDTSDRKLVQVLLIGQPELRTMLEMPVLEPLAQRVVARFHLPALPEGETIHYIAHRLQVAGLAGPLPFDAEALARIHALCGGVPRRINVLCDRALMAAHSARAAVVDQRLVDVAAGSVFGRLKTQPEAAEKAPDARPDVASTAAAPPERGWKPGWLLAGGAALGAVAVALLLQPWQGVSRSPDLRAGGGSAAMAASSASGAAAGRAATASGASAPALVPPAPAAERFAFDDVFSSAASYDEARAWRALAPLWGASSASGTSSSSASNATGDVCSALAAQGLRCHRGRGGLAVVRQLGRPGIVKLGDEQGRSAHVLLVGLDADRATLRIGGRDQAVPLAQLARAWRGEFATLWRTPPGYREAEAAGTLAPWLGERLALVEGGRPASGAASSISGSNELQDRLFAFQLTQGLRPDGLAGPMTLMLLNRASGVDEPRLLQTGARSP